MSVPSRHGRRGGRLELGKSKNVDSWISELDPSLRQIAEALRNIVLSAEPVFAESIKWSNPIYEKNGKVCYIASTERYVTLGFFNGVALADPEGRIEGSGKRMRHVKVKSLEDMDIDQLGSWVVEAAALDERDPQ